MMLKPTLTIFMLPALLLLGSSSDNSAARMNEKSPDVHTETIQKLATASGNVALEVDLNQLNNAGNIAETFSPTTLQFAITPSSFFTVIVSNDLLRGPIPSTMELAPQNSAPNLPSSFRASLHQLTLEKTQPGELSDLVIRDSSTGFSFFNIEGHLYDYDAASRTFKITDGRLLLADDFAKELGLSASPPLVVGKISVTASMRPIEIETIVNGELQSAILPALHPKSSSPEVGTTPGPDVIVGNISDMAQFGGTVNGKVGVAVGTDSCNAGTVDLDWFALPNNDHPVIPQNLYRMSGGAGNSDRFEQIGQSWLKHAFTAASSNTCGFGCNGVGG